MKKLYWDKTMFLADGQRFFRRSREVWWMTGGRPVRRVVPYGLGYDEDHAAAKADGLRAETIWVLK